MQLLRAFVFWFLVVCLTSCNLVPVTTTSTFSTPPSSPSETPVPNADILFTNGTILTMEDTMPQPGTSAQAIAIQGDKILAMGTNEEVLKLQGQATRLIDLEGRVLMPGFVDAHSHLFDQHLIYDEDPLPDQEMAIEYGMTTTADFYVDQSILEKLKALADADELRMRVNLYLLHTTNCGEVIGDWWKAYQPNQQIAPNLFIRGIKIFADGGSCKAPAMSVGYPGGGKGDLFFTQDQLNQMVAHVQAAGFQVAIHALGDRAVEEAQNAIAFALNGQPNIYRHRIEHNATIRPELLPRYGEIGIIPIIFGTYSTCIRSTGEARNFKYILSEEYGAWDWPWRALVDANPNLPIAWQADYPIFGNINLSPVYNMWGMVTRKQVNSDGSICDPPDWLKAGALRIEEVLPMMTHNAAYALFFENEIGSLEAGKLADLVILSENPLNVESDQLKDINVLMTMIGGKVEYCAAGSETLCPFSPLSQPQTDSVTITASTSLPDSPPTNATDGNPETVWNSGADPEQWIQLDLGKSTTVTAVRLTITQYPTGEAIHQIWGGESESSLQLLYEFKGQTTEFQVLEFNPSTAVENIRIIRVITIRSPSWVAWREIEIVSP